MPDLNSEQKRCDMNKQKCSKKASQKDWHPADIVAALRKAGWSLRKLSIANGYAAPTTLTVPLNRPWPKGERIIAAAIGIDPARIWPSRYQHKHTTGVHERSDGRGGAA